MKWPSTLRALVRVFRSLDAIDRTLLRLVDLYELDLTQRYGRARQGLMGSLAVRPTQPVEDESSVTTLDPREALAFERALEQFQAIKGREPYEEELDEIDELAGKGGARS